MTNPLATPLQIGGTAIQSRVMLAPMAGVTDVIFRAIVREWARDSLICTEMISSNGLVYSKRWDADILDQSQNDQPIAYQFSASRVEVLTEAAKRIEADHRPATIDLNMGCPVKKITGNFEGCALMKEPEKAYELISALVKAVETPVTVKFRLGWDSESMNYVAFGRMCEEAGASMVTLHARTRAQGYKPGVKWEAFGELKEALSIPVIANGDIISLEDALTVMNTYGVDGVMIGRGALGQPWLLGQIDRALKTGVMPADLTLPEKMEIAWRHAVRLAEYKGEVSGVREMRRHLTDYMKGFRGASRMRTAIVQVNTLQDVRAILDEVIAGSETLALAV
ncbi:MAG: tRNA dihydrouridine synthase DusB [Candidatus Melainabacteria bacterium]